MKNKKLNIKGIKIMVNAKDSITLSYDKNLINFEEVIKYFNENDIKILDIVTDDGDLEDVFVQLTNR